MNPTKVTVPQLFQMHLKFVVPIFQRQYVWDEKKQWEPLWDDIRRKADEVLSGSTRPEHVRRHFLGAVVLRSLPQLGNDLPMIDVIDGQQRLTTLQIVLVALCDHLTAASESRLAKNVASLVRNPDFSGDSTTDLNKLIPTWADRTVYGNVMSAGTPSELRRLVPAVRKKYARQDEPRPHLARAYDYFFEALADYARGEPDDEPVVSTSKRLEAVWLAITQRLELVRIDLEPDDDPQAIFETLNARGEPLRPSDLVRNMVFLDISRATPSLVKSLYDAHWSWTDDPFWKELQSQGRLRIPRIDVFLYQFLSSQLEDLREEVLFSSTYPAFQRWWSRRRSSGVTSIEDDLKLIQRSAMFFKRLTSRTGSDRLDEFAKRLRAFDTSTLYPLALFLFVEREEEVRDSVPEIVADLESYVVRRAIVGHTPKNYNRVFSKLLVDLRRAPVTPERIRTALSALVGPSVEWPTDVALALKWLKTPVYLTLKGRVSTILQALDASLYGSKQERAAPLSGLLSVEHLLPQSPKPDVWPLAVAEDPTEEERAGAQLRRDEAIHTFGNLTLVTSSLNASLSNGPWPAKRKALAEQSLLMLNKYFAKPECESWDEDAIERRSLELFELARSIWPGPTLRSLGS